MSVYPAFSADCYRRADGVAALSGGGVFSGALRCVGARASCCSQTGAAVALLCIPYVLVTVDRGRFSVQWLILYAALPVAMAAHDGIFRLLGKGRGYWLELLVLARPWLVGGPSMVRARLARTPVDLQQSSAAGCRHLCVHRDSQSRGRGLRSAAYACATCSSACENSCSTFPIALGLGLALGFLHVHPWGIGIAPVLLKFAGAWVFTFFFIAVPEELFFRGWLQNLLERHLGRGRALVVVAILFGLSHFNKRAEFFNWRYVLLAAIAGIFYGRAWRRPAPGRPRHPLLTPRWTQSGRYGFVRTGLRDRLLHVGEVSDAHAHVVIDGSGIVMPIEIPRMACAMARGTRLR